MNILFDDNFIKENKVELMRKFILYRHTYVTMSPLGIQYEYIYIHKYTHKYTHTQINIYIYKHAHIQNYTHIQLNSYAHSNIYRYAYTNIHLLTQKNKHIYTHSQRLKYRHTHANIEHTLIHLHLCACLSTHTQKH